MYEILNQLDDDIIKCMKCGLCHAHDPIYQETLDEAVGARGQVWMTDAVVKDKIELDDIYVDRMFTCLWCKQCVTNCPTGTEPDKIIMAGRAEAFKKYGAQKLFSLYGDNLGATVTSSSAAVKRIAALQRVVQNQLPADNPWNLPILAGSSFAEHLAKTSVQEMFPVEVKAKKSRGRVGFFISCLNNWVMPEVGKAAVDLLVANGFDVILPADQKCCGGLFQSLGDLDSARVLAEDNLKAFQAADIDTVVTGCAACALTLKKDYVTWLGNNPLSAKVVDITQFLAGLENLVTGKVKAGQKVTYHDPCHLSRGLKVKAEPRKLLKSVSGAEYVEMSGADACCGYGQGVFAFTHPQLAKKLAEPKLANIEKSGAEVVATGCGICMLHLQEQLGQKATMKHTVQVLAEGLG